MFAPQKATRYPEGGSGWSWTGTLVFQVLSRNKSNQATVTAFPSRAQAWGELRWFLTRRGYTVQGDSAKIITYICLCCYNRS